MTTSTDQIEKILKHPFVSRAYRNGVAVSRLTDNAALRLLLRARRQRHDAKAGRKNFAEEAAAAANIERRCGPGAAHDAGYLSARPRVPDCRNLISRALTAPGHATLPADLLALIAAAISAEG